MAFSASMLWLLNANERGERGKEKPPRAEKETAIGSDLAMFARGEREKKRGGRRGGFFCQARLAGK